MTTIIFISLEESMMSMPDIGFQRLRWKSSRLASICSRMCRYWNKRCWGQIPLALVVTKLHDEIEHFQLEHEIIRSYANK
jgi:hypothetical protein